MGYSCTQKAMQTLDKTIENAHRMSNCNEGSNTWTAKGSTFFYEIGREQADGSITGTVHKFTDATHCVRFGSIKILPDGQVKTWAGMPKERIVQPKTWDEIRKQIVSNHLHNCPVS